MVSLTPFLLAVLTASEGGGGMEIGASSTVEGRPAPEDVSDLQPLIDTAEPGATIEVRGGVHAGDLYIDRPVRLVGLERPLLLGSGRGSVVRIRSASVSIEGFDVDGREGGDLGRDSSGVHVFAPRVVVRDCVIGRTIFGIYLRDAHGARVEGCTVRGIESKDAGEKGSGVHVYNTNRFELIGNDIAGVRDGLYIQSSSFGTIRKNHVRDLRYGLHYMYSDDNVFEDNLFENADAGTVLMYSRRIQLRRNQLVHNRGFASVGLLFKACDDSIAEDNLIADNARGIFVEGSYRNIFRRNVVAESDAAIVLYDSSGQNVFEGNSFFANLTPLTLVGRRTDTRFDGNYWSDAKEPDLDGDGRGDRPYRLGSLFDHLRGNLTAADLLASSLAAAALSAAERSFPVLDPIEAVDHAPLVRPPALPDVPSPARRGARRDLAGLLSSILLLGAGAVVLAAGRRSRR